MVKDKSATIGKRMKFDAAFWLLDWLIALVSADDIYMYKCQMRGNEMLIQNTEAKKLKHGIYLCLGTEMTN